VACINPDGTLTPTAQAVIATLETPCTPVEIAGGTNLPVYRVRSTIRELIEAGFVIEADGKYRLTENGMKRGQQ